MRFRLKSLSLNWPKLTVRVVAIMDAGESEVVYTRKIHLRSDAKIDDAIEELTEELNPQFRMLHDSFRNLVVEQPSLFESFTEQRALGALRRLPEPPPIKG